jgi:signal transduction histidine kinase
LSYISFELERIIEAGAGHHHELDRLHHDVQTAIDELRETLRQLRAEVTEDRNLATVAAELLDRFNARSQAGGGPVATLTVVDPAARLGVLGDVGQRLLEDAEQLGLDPHAEATTVTVRWDVADGAGTLIVQDDGRGFDPGRVVRDNAYGLVGMRERADVMGASLQVDSAPGQGTTITVRAGRTREDVST